MYRGGLALCIMAFAAQFSASYAVCKSKKCEKSADTIISESRYSLRVNLGIVVVTILYGTNSILRVFIFHTFSNIVKQDLYGTSYSCAVLCDSLDFAG
jgi:hypothetical protein